MKTTLLLCVALGLAACSSKKTEKTLSSRMRLAVDMFDSCVELKDYIRDVKKEEREAYDHWDPDDSPVFMSVQSDAAGAADGAVNVQEAAVDEADRLRVTSKQLFFSRGDRIEVIARSGLTLVGELNLDNAERLEMFSSEENLTVLAIHSDRVEVRDYRLKAGFEMPEPIAKRSISGRYADARYLRGRVVLLLTGFLDEALEGIERCDRVSVPLVRDADFGYSKLVSLSASNLNADPEELVLLGMHQTLYMTSESIYTVKQGVNWPGEYFDDAVLAKVALESNGKLSYQAAGTVKGHLKDRWALKEYAAQHALAVATTFTDAEGLNNQLAVLVREGEKLELKATVSDFGKREDIRAIRYVENIAYVVTFEKTDPLFAFDMSNPLSPKRLGELEVPGFSVYLHPASGGRLLGLGFAAADMGEFSWFQGIQFSLFDVSNPLDIKRLDNKVHGTRGSYSEAAGDPHAFYYNDADAIAAFPVTEWKNGHEGNYGTEITFSGAVVYQVTQGLTERYRISHRHWIPEICKKRAQPNSWWQDAQKSLDIARINKVDGKLIAVSAMGLTAHELTGQEKHALAFPSQSVEFLCPEPSYGYER